MLPDHADIRRLLRGPAVAPERIGPRITGKRIVRHTRLQHREAASVTERSSTSRARGQQSDQNASDFPLCRPDRSLSRRVPAAGQRTVRRAVGGKSSHVLRSPQCEIEHLVELHAATRVASRLETLVPERTAQCNRVPVTPLHLCWSRGPVVLGYLLFE